MRDYSNQELAILLHTCIGRRDDYALQRANGLYRRVGQPLSVEVLRAHLHGRLSLGTYVIDEMGCCRFVVYDADGQMGLLQLLSVQERLSQDGIASYLEGSRRGGHLWVFLARSIPAGELRGWLYPYTPAGIECYPKQDTASHQRPGSLIRVPLGVHRRSGRRYPFVERQAGKLVPVARSVSEALSFLSTVQRVQPPGSVPASGSAAAVGQPAQKKFSSFPSLPATGGASPRDVRDWCLSQDPLAVIGRYVELDGRGMGCCPFGWHHQAGQDRHPSLWVHRPRRGQLACWLCLTWQRGGSLFDFLCLWYDLAPREMWRRILKGERF